MVERADMRTIFSNVDSDRYLYRTLLSERFGHLDPDTLAEMMQVMRDALKNGQEVTINQVHQQLADKMIMVGGRNPLATEQLNIIWMAYGVDQPAWDAVIQLYEIEQRTKNG